MYPNQNQDSKVQETIVSEWLRILADVPDALALAAYDEWSKSKEKFAPPPGWIYSRAVELAGRGAGEMAEAAWQSVLDCEFGRHLDGMDPLALAAMRSIGGFEQFANSRIEDGHFWHDRFVPRYTELVERAQGRAMIGTGTGALRLEGMKR